jgi:hypothetical protein
MSKTVLAHARLVNGDSHIEGILGKLGSFQARFSLMCPPRWYFLQKSLDLVMARMQETSQRCGALTDAIHGGIYIGVLPAVNGPLAPAMEVATAMPRSPWQCTSMGISTSLPAS